MEKDDIRWIVQMILIIVVPILVEYIRQKELFKHRNRDK